MPLYNIARAALLALAFSTAPGLVGCAAAEPPMENRPVSIPDMTALDESPFPASKLEGQVVLFVNVASKCGFTPQYEGLEALYEAKKDAGLVIVGVPCNQFGGQEPGKPEEIATFCKMNYGVTFPLLEKQSVNGKQRSPLYQFLVGSEVGGNKGIKWNFTKFLVNREGAVIGRWGSRTTPDDAELVAAIDAALAASK